MHLVLWNIECLSVLLYGVVSFDNFATTLELLALLILGFSKVLNWLQKVVLGAHQATMFYFLFDSCILVASDNKKLCEPLPC